MTSTTASITPEIRWWARPIGWPIFSTAAIASASVLLIGIHPALYYMRDVFFLWLLWTLVVVTYLLRLATCQALASRARLSLPPATWRREGVLFLIPLIVTLLIAVRLPLRVGFLTAVPGLTELVKKSKERSGPMLASDQRFGLYTISASAGRTCHVRDRILFRLANDPESALIYSPNGIDDLCYNSGNKGHLWGNWYWMSED